ncbi:alpha/beta hydrolase [Williamsia sp.]|uniref:alpha/beta fold hydrolase n=1 Tax=Williamsia sp. TaxID=1872085 RepID=UPI001A1C591B|nr:alpha/beta hydrolase [Williamsia sp.]MBJ7290418.1 alpha/beta hydrolase [Williamsia sp.]
MTDTSPPTTLRIDLPELAITALTWGPDDGPLAVALHGYPDSAWSWRHLGPALAERGYRVVAPFTRGYAPTDIPGDGDFHIGALMHDAIGVHQALGGGRDAVLIGHDWGAVTANAIGAHRRSPFRAVVSMSVPPVPAMTRSDLDPRTRLGLLRRQARMSWYMFFNQIPIVSERSLDRLIPKLWRDWSPGHDATDDLVHVFDALPTLANRKAALQYYRSVATPGRPAARYRELHDSWRRAPKVPTLYLHGADDGCMRVEFVSSVREVLPEGSRVAIIEGAGHFLQVEQPDAVNAEIIDFLGT